MQRNCNIFSFSTYKKMLKAFVFLFNIIRLTYGYSLPWSYDKVSLWANFEVTNKSLLTNYQAEFVATHYNIISLGKCLANAGRTGIPSEDTFYKIAASIRQYASTNETKILFAWPINSCGCKCYNFTDTFCSNQSMWFKDDNGIPINGSGGHNPVYDLTQQYVRDWWVNSLINVIMKGLNQNISINGAWGDGACKNWSDSKYNVSVERSNQYINGAMKLMDETRQKFKQINDDLFFVANGLCSHSYFSDYCTHIIPHTDGIWIEHFGAFDGVEVNNYGKLNATVLLNWFNITKSIIRGDYGSNKFVLIKSWIGPEVTPINHNGPTWPIDYGTTPTTHLEIQNASMRLLDFTLAAYLCGMYEKNVYLSYAWWYNIAEGYVPCPNNPSSCDCPINWYQQFINTLGEPITNGIFTDTFKCNRSFQNAHIYVDLNDNTSAVIDWT
eukprot:257371_1